MEEDIQLYFVAPLEAGSQKDTKERDSKTRYLDFHRTCNAEAPTLMNSTAGILHPIGHHAVSFSSSDRCTFL